MASPAFRSLLLPLLALALATACKKTDPEPGSVPAEPAAPSAQAPEFPPLEDTSFRFPAVDRIVAIGDLHGDVSATRAALRLAGALGEDDHWSGGRLVVVQTGDQLDRGDDEPEILDLLERLAAEAKAAGGALHTLNGNHEVMNVQGDFRYVTEDGFRDFQKEPLAGSFENHVRSLPEPQRGRGAAFLPGRGAAKRLAKRPIVIQVGENVFVHGGLLERHVRYGLGRMNREVSEWMERGSVGGLPRIVTNEQAPIWLRTQSEGTPSAAVCAELGRVLAWLGAKRLVVGHTVQPRGITSACKDQVWRIDVGLARAYGPPGGNPTRVLEIRGDQTTVLEGGRAP